MHGRLSKVVLWLCGLACALGAAGVLGNVLDEQHLTSIVPGRPGMRLITALLILSCALAVSLQRREHESRSTLALSRALGLLVCVEAILVLLEYVCDADFGVDWHLANRQATEPNPGRPSPFAAATVAALGGAIVLRGRSSRATAAAREGLCLFAIFVAFTTVIGHAFGAGQLYEVHGSHVIGVALPTGIALTALGVAAWLNQPQFGLMRLASAPGPGGQLLRRLGIVAILGGPFLVGVFLLLTKAVGLHDLSLILAVASVLGVLCGVCLLAATAVPLERSAAQSELNRARELQLLEQAPLGVFVADLTGRYTDVNTAACKLLGYTRDELLGKTITDLIPEADAPRLWRTREQLLVGVKQVDEWTLKRKDGTFVSVEVTAKVLADGRWQAFVSDITERLQLEHRQQRHLAEQEFLSRVGMELAACLDHRETLACVTQLATSFLGDMATIDLMQDSMLRRAVVLGRSESQAVAHAVVGLGSALGDGHPLAIVIETKQPLLLTTIGAEDRKRFAISAEHARILDAVNATSAMFVPLIARGQLLAVLSIAARNDSRAYDSDDLRVAVELGRRAALALDNVQLLEQWKLQAAVTINLAEAVIVGRSTDGSIVYANARAQTMFGFSATELLELPMAALLAPSAGGSMRERIAQELATAAAWHGELECVRRDGSELWCSISVSEFEHVEHGRVWIALYTDISERRRALQEKEVLLREIHHRVKNNLQVVSSLFALQRERSTSPELKMLLDESRLRVASIALVHEQLYRAADLAAIDFDKYLRELTEAIRSSYGAQHIALRVDAKEVLLEIDQAVPCAIVVCELVSNSLRHAFDAAPGEVWVRAQRDAQGFCVLEVGDNGRGLAAGFDWKEARSLGLKLVYSLARQLRATITVECTQGTRFTLRFPSAKAELASVRAAAG